MLQYSTWMRTNISTRNAIASAFGIQKKGSTEVFNNEVVRDGYPIGDLETALTLDNINAFLGTKTKKFDDAWKMLIDKVEGREVKESVEEIEVVLDTSSTPPEVIEVKPETVMNTNVVVAPPEPPKKRGRPAKTRA